MTECCFADRSNRIFGEDAAMRREARSGGWEGGNTKIKSRECCRRDRSNQQTSTHPKAAGVG